MIADDPLILDEDDARHDALIECFEQMPEVAYEAYGRVLKASNRKSAEQAANSQRRMAIAAKRSDWLSFNRVVQRDIDRGEAIHKETAKAFESNKKKIASADREMVALRAATPIPSLSAEALANFLLESKGQFEEVSWPEVKLPKGQPLLGALVESRKNIAAAIRERAATRNAPASFELAVKRIEADVRAKATAPDFRPTAKFKAQYTEQGHRVRDALGHVLWPKQEEYLEGGRKAEFELGIGMICWLFEKEIVAAGVAGLKKQYDANKGLSEQEREEELARIEADLLAEERREEALVRECEDAGIEVYRRPLANPLAVLGIAPKV